MRATLIPVPDFLDAAIRASQEARQRYEGLVVALDRQAERSRLLEELTAEGGSINDVTRRDLLIVLPGSVEPGDEWVLDPRKGFEDGVGARGLTVVAGPEGRPQTSADSEARTDARERAQSWATSLWEAVSDKVERFDSEDSTNRLAHAVENSASAICDYLGLDEADIPSLVVLALADRRIFVFRYGGDADPRPYQLFKKIADRRRAHGGWLAEALTAIAGELGLQEDEPPSLAPAALDDWTAIRYLPRGQRLTQERARG